jgi:glycosyltransferase involved in cell wall biosynthesis
MRIGITTFVYPPDIGGPATYLAKAARYLADKGHEVRVVTFGQSSTREVVSDRLTVYRQADQIPRLARHWRIIQLIRKTLCDCDVLLCNSLTSQTMLANITLMRPVVVKLVGDEAWERAQLRGRTNLGYEDYQNTWVSLVDFAERKLRDWSLRRATQLLAVSPQLAALGRRAGLPGNRVHVIANPIFDRSPAGGALPHEASRSEGSVVTVARLVPWKGLLELVHAFAEAKLAGHLTIVGDGPLREPLRQLGHKCGLGERLYLPGRCSHDEVRRHLREHEMFVLNARWEGFPHVVIEALAERIPIIAADIPGTRQILTNGQTGRLVPPGRADELAYALRHLHESPELRACLAERGYRKVAEWKGLQWEHHLARLEEWLIESAAQSY